MAIPKLYWCVVFVAYCLSSRPFCLSYLSFNNSLGINSQLTNCIKFINILTDTIIVQVHLIHFCSPFYKQFMGI